ncbi:hypothetical protein PENTCL1PPCAC_7985, partial [Pristionchus entomophagus]
RKSSSSWWANSLKVLTRSSSSIRYREPQDLIERYIKADKAGDINHLVQAKRMLHKRLRHICTTAKIVNVRLPA